MCGKAELLQIYRVSIILDSIEIIFQIYNISYALVEIQFYLGQKAAKNNKCNFKPFSFIFWIIFLNSHIKSP